MAEALSITTNSGTQSATGTPQAVGAAAQSGTVQPGTANTVLTSSGGVPLSIPALTTVELPALGSDGGAVASSQGIATTPPPTNQASPNLLLIGFPVLLAVMAFVLFLFIKASSKKAGRFY